MSYSEMAMANFSRDAPRRRGLLFGYDRPMVAEHSAMATSDSHLIRPLARAPSLRNAGRRGAEHGDDPVDDFDLPAFDFRRAHIGRARRTARVAPARLRRIDALLGCAGAGTGRCRIPRHCAEPARLFA